MELFVELNRKISMRDDPGRSIWDFGPIVAWDLGPCSAYAAGDILAQ